jgi:hypothetical protein
VAEMLAVAEHGKFLNLRIRRVIVILDHLNTYEFPILGYPICCSRVMAIQALVVQHKTQTQA